eukprot:814085-Amphidinium_carterae.1
MVFGCKQPFALSLASGCTHKLDCNNQHSMKRSQQIWVDGRHSAKHVCWLLNVFPSHVAISPAVKIKSDKYTELVTSYGMPGLGVGGGWQSVFLSFVARGYAFNIL